MVKNIRVFLRPSMGMLLLTLLASVAVAQVQTPALGADAPPPPAGALQAGPGEQEAPRDFGVVKQVDPRNNTIVIETRASPTAMTGQDLTFTVGAGAVKGQQLSELKAGQYVQFTRTVHGTKVGPSHPETPGQEIKQPLAAQGEGTKVGASHKAMPEQEIKQPLQTREPSAPRQSGSASTPAVAPAGETITSLEVLPESAWRMQFQRQSLSAR